PLKRLSRSSPRSNTFFRNLEPPPALIPGKDRCGARSLPCMQRGDYDACGDHRPKRSMPWAACWARTGALRPGVVWYGCSGRRAGAGYTVVLRCGPCPHGSPLHHGREAHQIGLRIGIGAEAEAGATVVDQIELYVAAALLQQALAGGIIVRGVLAARDDPRVDREERLPHLPYECKIRVAVTAR